MLQPIFYCRNVDATRRSGSDRCQSQMLVKNRDFFPSWGGGPYRNIAITLLRLVRKKPERSGYPTVKFFLKICLFVSTEYINVTDRQSDRRTDKWTRARTVRRHSPRLCIMHSIARQFYE